MLPQPPLTPPLPTLLLLLLQDLVFIDHVKHAYLSDFLVLKEHGFLRPGTVIVADNILIPGAPDYKAYMQKSTELRTVFHP